MDNNNEPRVKVTPNGTEDAKPFLNDSDALKAKAREFKANAQPYLNQAKPYLEQAKQVGITAGLAATHYGAKGLSSLNKKLQELEESQK